MAYSISKWCFVRLSEVCEQHEAQSQEDQISSILLSSIEVANEMMLCCRASLLIFGRLAVRVCEEMRGTSMRTYLYACVVEWNWMCRTLELNVAKRLNSLESVLTNECIICLAWLMTFWMKYLPRQNYLLSKKKYFFFSSRVGKYCPSLHQIEIKNVKNENINQMIHRCFRSTNRLQTKCL